MGHSSIHTETLLSLHHAQRVSLHHKICTYKSRLLKKNKTPKRTLIRNARHTGTTMASISPFPKQKGGGGEER